MKKYKHYTKMLAALCVVVLLFSCAFPPTYGKYTFSKVGQAMASYIAGEIFSDAFVLNDNIFIDSNGNPKNETTSESLHGTGMITNSDGSYTVPSNVNTSANSLSSTTNKIFVVQNNSSYDLVACFDIILCMGLISDGELTCTITEQSSGTALTITTSLNNNNQNSDIKLKHHKESADDTGDDPIINVQITGLFSADYSAYSLQIDPTNHLGDVATGEVANMINSTEFQSFILVKSGETKSFTLNVTADENILSFLAKNCYASMTMTAKKYVPAS